MGSISIRRLISKTIKLARRIRLSKRRLKRVVMGLNRNKSQ
jgi:hypothetical protein